ncbi:hypothetical protein N9J19_00670 [bacterium]|nr:hypothetical protein [bacterium]
MSKQWHGGKGDTPRASNGSAYADGWELAFGKKKPEVKARKSTPKVAQSKVHRDKKNDYKRTVLKQSDLNWDGNLKDNE